MPRRAAIKPAERRRPTRRHSRREDPGWTAPRKVVLAVQQQWLGDLQAAVPDLKVVAPRSQAELLAEIADADAVLGQLDAELLKAAKNLRWFHSNSAGVNQYVGADDSSPGLPGFAEGPVVLTNGRRCYGPNIADQVFAYLLAFTRKAKHSSMERTICSPRKGMRPMNTPMATPKATVSRVGSHSPGSKRRLPRMRWRSPPCSFFLRGNWRR